MRNNPRLYVYTPLLIYWLFLFSLTTIPADKLPQIFIWQDKLQHFIAYLILSMLLTLTVHFQNKIYKFAQRPFSVTFWFTTIYASIDEIHQAFIPGRYCDIFDLIFDITGGTVGIFIIHKFLNTVKEQKQFKI
ncbi:VanZ family protein [Melioribacter sp. OK-6-Me]|uniref:VanZ family protein n=1 Tax=Melioribacter sp. OK-6-Me TaxID=3423433 RepID=UPI003ED9EDA8